MKTPAAPIPLLPPEMGDLLRLARLGAHLLSWTRNNFEARNVLEAWYAKEMERLTDGITTVGLAQCQRITDSDIVALCSPPAAAQQTTETVEIECAWGAIVPIQERPEVWVKADPWTLPFVQVEVERQLERHTLYKISWYFHPKGQPEPGAPAVAESAGIPAGLREWAEKWASFEPPRMSDGERGWMCAAREVKKLFVDTAAPSQGAAGQELQPGHDHLTLYGEFKSDKYPWCPAGFVPLKLTDKSARDLLIIYANRRGLVDEAFGYDLLEALGAHGEEASAYQVVSAASPSAAIATSGADNVCHKSEGWFCPHCRPCRLAEKLGEAESVLRNLACSLAAGGHNDTAEGLEFNAKLFEEKIHWGIDHIISVERKRAAEEALRAAPKLESALSEGVWVPREPTREMIIAANEAIQDEMSISGIYQAMLSAAPISAAEGRDEENS